MNTIATQTASDTSSTQRDTPLLSAVNAANVFLATAGFPAAVQIARTWYAQRRNNHYRSWIHGMEVFAATWAVTADTDLDTRVAVLLAALRRDSVYLQPEEKALSLEGTTAPLDTVPVPTQVDIVKQLLSKLEHTALSAGESEAIDILVDADRYHLAGSYDEFHARQFQIIKFTGRSPSCFGPCVGAGKELGKLMTDQETIYRTETARMLWEDSARSNITRWIAQYS